MRPLPTSAVHAAAALLLLLASTAAAQGRADASAAPRAPRDRPWAGVRYDGDAVSGLQAWHELSLEVAHPAGDAMLIARARGAQRFGVRGAQLEGEAYPRFGTRTYGYLGAAVSSSTAVYPRLRLAAEAYRSLPAAWEASLGARFVRAVDLDVVTYTGTVARYVGNYWLMARPSLTRYRGEQAQALAGIARRYFSGRHDYLSLSASVTAGADPEARDPQRLARATDLHAWALHVDRLQPIGGDVRLRVGAGFEREGLSGGGTRQHRTVVLGFDRVLP